MTVNGGGGRGCIDGSGDKCLVFVLESLSTLHFLNLRLCVLKGGVY